jgi:S-DNA-T family DNA segregation ATPase FtsK/SpoIIIE
MFHRPVRVLPPRLPSDPVVIAAPPQPAGRDTGSSWLVLLMPLLSSISMAAYLMSGGRRPLVLLGAAIVVLSIGVTVGIRVQVRGAARREKLRARDRYLDHLGQVRDTARQVAADQRAIAAWTHPSPHRLRAVAARRRRVWERRPADPDFLRVRVGTGRAPLATPIRLATRNDPTVEYDPRAKAAADRLLLSTAEVEGQPVLVDLARAGVVSVLGPRRAARDLVRSLLLQVAVLHAPDDVAIAVRGGAAEWEWAKWLPHTHEAGVTGAAGVAPLVTEEFDCLADHLRAVLDAAERRPAPRPAPHDPARAAADDRPRLLVVLDGYDPRAAWARTPVATETLAAAGPGSGVTVVCLAERESDEPTRADLRVRVEADGAVSVENRRAEPLSPVTGARADLTGPVLAEAVARALAPLRLHDEPDEVLARTMTLPQMLGVPDLDAFVPEDAWTAPDEPGVLRLPIGFDAEGEPCVLDLKEAAHGGSGPHGLVVGATGSGKSELLRTLVTGLAMRHSPELLSLVLVDFKGGATFAGMTGLPHVAGLITNLADDLAMVDRVRDALVGEQQRRQRMLRDAGNVDTVRDYQTRRAAGATGPDGRSLEPLPYLLVIVDEFGELLSARPEFSELFVQIGRVGRSLGMHLLLASQRLEEGRLRGLESNLSYRVCLRTFSAAESRAVLGTPDAYHLPAIPGSAYLKTADNECRRFRVAHVSGPYRATGEDEPPAAPAAPVPFGPRTLAAPPRPERDTPARPRPAADAPTELRVAVDRMSAHGQAVHQVWLPPLPAALSLADLTGPAGLVPGRGMSAAWWPDAGRLRLPVGVLDIPVRQSQQPLVLDFGRDGHLAVVGAPQSGKSVLLRTLLLSAMLTHTPDEAQFLCLDFGGGGLRGFERAPHVSGVAGRHDPARARRVLGETLQLVEERERLFRRLGLDSAARFRELRDAGGLPDGTRAADVFLVVDNWGAARAELPGIEAAATEVAARGLGVAVHLVLATNRWAELRMALRDSISGRLELRLGDPAESEVNRRAARLFSALPPGRGLAPPGAQYHAALPRLDGRGTVEGLAEAQDEALAKLAQAWPGPGAPPVRTLPERLFADRLTVPGDGTAPPGVPVGIAEQDLAPVHLDVGGADPHFLVFGDSGSGKSEFLRTWMTGLAARRPASELRFVIVDPRRSLLGAVPDAYVGAYAGDAAAVRAYGAEVAAKLAERLPPRGVTVARLAARDWWSGPDFYLVVDDYDLVGGGRPSPFEPFTEFLPHARDIGLHVVVARRVAGTTRGQLSESLLTRVRDLGADGLLLSGDPREGALLGDHRASAGLPPGRGLLIRRRTGPQTVQIALTRRP